MCGLGMLSSKFRLLAKEESQNQYIGVLISLHHFALYGNDYYVLNIDSVIYLQRKSSFSLCKTQRSISAPNRTASIFCIIECS